MNLFYDLVYVSSTIVSIVLYVYLIKIAHLFIIERRWPRWN